MNSLESPLEALALNYLSYGFLTAVNSIWAWVAVITAAVSFWRIRSTSSSPTSLRCLSQDAASSTSTLSNIINAVEPTTTVSKKPMMLERQGSTKMKFTAYFINDHEDDDVMEEKEDACVDDDEDEDEKEEEEKMGWWCGDRERVRMGDMGWYTWQDRTVLDGSVVRLWEGHRRRGHVAAVVDLM